MQGVSPKAVCAAVCTDARTIVRTTAREPICPAAAARNKKRDESLPCGLTAGFCFHLFFPLALASVGMVGIL